MPTATDKAILIPTARVAEMVGFSTVTVIRWAKEGRHGFPPPAIESEGSGGGSKRWHVNDVNRWLRRMEQGG